MNIPASVGTIHWRRGALQALLLGVTVSALESVPAATAYYEGVDVARFLLSLFVMWSVRAMPLAWTAQYAEGRWPSALIVLVFLIEAALLAALWDSNPDLTDLTQRWFGARLPTPAQYLYSLWVMLVFGGAFMIWCLVEQRALRVRGLLARAESERARTLAQEGAARAEALEARIEPALLLRSLQALRDGYASDPDRADATLDTLVSFLRLAVPRLAEKATTLASEWALLRAYVALAARVDPAFPRCDITSRMPPKVAFPPLLLVPLVEALRARRADGALRMDWRVEGSRLALVFDAQVARDWLDSALANRLERMLGPLFPADAARWQAGSSPALILWLPLEPADPLREK